MDKRFWRLIWTLGLVGGLFWHVGGCAVNRTPKGWLVRSGCTLEYESPLHCSLHGPNSDNCCSTDRCENNTCSEPCGEALSSDSAENIIGNNENSGWLRLLQSRGRLGICANCKKLMRVNPSSSAAPPPTAGVVQVNPRFNPVPTQPVFTAREFPLATGNIQEVPSGRQVPGPPVLSPTPSPSTAPEEIPAPPVAANSGDDDKPALPLKKSKVSSNDSQESSTNGSSWAFSKPPEQKPDPVIEIIPPSAYNKSSSGAGGSTKQR
jgi:hypothetical protein